MNKPMVVSFSGRRLLSRLALGILAGASLLSATGCSSSEKKQEQPPCPRVSVLADTSHLTRFRPGAGRDLTDVQIESEIGNYHGSCLYNFETHTMNLKMQLSVDGKLGPAAQGRKVDLAYFVAVPAYFPKQEAKKVIPVTLTFPDNTDRVRYTDDEIELNLPIPKIHDLAAYEVFVGLQMTPDEVEYNRSLRGGR